MTVRVIIGDEAIEKAQSKPVVAKLEMIIRRTMDGDYMIMDHTDVDIIVMPKKMKVVAFPKNLMSDLVYSTENRMFKFLSKKGLISVSSIQAGSIYGSLEAKMLVGETHDTVKLTLLNIRMTSAQQNLVRFRMTLQKEHPVPPPVMPITGCLTLTNRGRIGTFNICARRIRNDTTIMLRHHL